MQGTNADFQKAHDKADTDFEPSSMHHTLGEGPMQGAPGNHNHDLAYADIAIEADVTALQTDVTNLQTDVTTLETAPLCHVVRNAAVNIANGGVGTAIPFDTALRNDGGMWAAGAPTRITISRPGYYHITGMGSLATITAGFLFQVQLNLNGVNIHAFERTATNKAGVTPQIGSGEYGFDLIAGDYLELVEFQNTGAAVAANVSQPYRPELIVAWKRA